MKKWQIPLAISAVGLSLFTTKVKAYDLSTDEYIRLRSVFSDARISIMTDEQIKKYLAMDLENAKTSTAYYKGVSLNPDNDSYTWTEITEEEYNLADEVTEASTYYETNYKKLNLAAVPLGNDRYSLTINAIWKSAPAIRSYDVIGTRFWNVALLKGSQTGTQVYKKTGDSNYSYVDYAPTSSHISIQDQGFGISMNLVNDDIKYLELILDAETLLYSSYGQIWGSYQHAASNVTFAQSQNYTISAAGYGGVINFAQELSLKYDGMKGVMTELPY